MRNVIGKARALPSEGWLQFYTVCVWRGIGSETLILSQNGLWTQILSTISKQVPAFTV